MKKKIVEITFDIAYNKYADKLKLEYKIDLEMLFKLKQHIIKEKIKQHDSKPFIKGYICANSLYQFTSVKLQEVTDHIYEYLIIEKTFDN